ncbi:GIY-YIG nuclease family protein [Clostridium botulinum]|uniref:GIY-YIG nuclease family protein n=1 Tax=Clostridium botulinum TaxID=1491 RepID=UPI0007745D13|nr:GIY-YIG nuclease family protein [Clostridium botulinum]NFL88073.1 GIY-YIG nuclease family protein [Clostridium botulinum]NFO22786.1 GIY-YIG nuclease family protein [Clostridium botulinum]
MRKSFFNLLAVFERNIFDWQKSQRVQGEDMFKRLLEYKFEFIQIIQPAIDEQGHLKEFYPENRYKNEKNINLNKHGQGPFCKFSIDPKYSGVCGVYALFICDELVYIGQCIDFAKRFNQGYGHVSPRNCFTGGQSTNCKINKVVLEASKNKYEIKLFFLITNNYDKIEKELIAYYNPRYNVKLKSDNRKMKEFNKCDNRSSALDLKEKEIKKQMGVTEVKEHILEQLNEAKKLKKENLRKYS